jgi:hypothetical protein
MVLSSGSAGATPKKPVSGFIAERWPSVSIHVLAVSLPTIQIAFLTASLLARTPENKPSCLPTILQSTMRRRRLAILKYCLQANP